MTSASKTLKPEEAAWNGRTLDMVEYGRALARYRAEVEARTGKPLEVPRNSGTRRTESKKALLAAIEATGKRW